MLKFLIILILIIYVFYKTAGFLFRMVFGSMRNDPGQFRKENKNTSRRAPGSNLSIDNVPGKSKGKKSSYEGGEYVDFEEVK
ncbi:MAG: hypothetical protein Tsb0034_07620 [Ekhidna sp.]